MRTVILTPYRPRTERDSVLWQWVIGWITANYPMPIFTGDNAGPFSRSAARNNAAKLAGDWDVAVFHDSDTIAHPDAIAQAVDMAANSLQMVVTADAHMYCNPSSTDRILQSGVPMFPRPDTFDKHGIYERPCSGVFAVSRDVFDLVGGYVDSLTGYGYEDLVFLQMCGLFAGGNTWVPGHINLHLWHPPSPRTHDTDINEDVWQTLTEFRISRDTAGARKYLASFGHLVP